MGPTGRRDLMEGPRTALGDEGFLWGGPRRTESVGEKTQGGAFLHRLPSQESPEMGVPSALALEDFQRVWSHGGLAVG